MVTPVSVRCETNPVYDNERYIHYMDVHSHNTMRAFFSQTDDEDEKATRVYAVIGRVLNFFPDIKVRISNGGTYWGIEPGVVFQEYNSIKRMALTWFSQIWHSARIISDMLLGTSDVRNGGELK
jgi:hypothetical protein